MNGNQRMASYLNENRSWEYPRDVPYHPRSDAHGRAQCRYFLSDLLHESKELHDRAEDGELVFEENYTVGDGGLQWNVDLVLGTGTPSEETDFPIDRGTPDDIWLSVDAKSIMTEHQKARKNRVRDLNSFADIMHLHNENAVAAGIVLLNTADRFDSPTRDPETITTHPNVDRICDETIGMLEEVNNNVDAVGCVPVSHTNNPDDTTTIDSHDAGSDVEYGPFVERVATSVEKQFCRERFFKRWL